MTGQPIEILALAPSRRASINESALVERCQSGDHDAWNTLCRRYARDVYNYAYSLCHNGEDANDIVGQVFLQLYQHLSRYRKQASFRVWLSTIVRNTFIDHYVRPAARKNVSLDSVLVSESEPFVTNDIMDHAPSPEAICIQREAMHRLSQAIQVLPPHQRQAFRMYYTEGKSYEEIAETMRVSLGTVKSRMHRARHQLRVCLTPDQDLFSVA